MLLYVNYPSFIHPQIFPNIAFLSVLRWYGLMYIFAFATVWIILKRLTAEGFLDSSGAKTSIDDVFSFLSCGIIFLLIGARVFSALVYDTSGLYREKPYLIFWPFDSAGHFTGLAGMSYHGGFIGGLFGMILWCCLKKRPALKWIDAMVICIPAGYTFGRLGNFLNGELYGRITASPVGMVFPHAERFSTSIQWVKDFCSSIGMDITGVTLANLPRHPSQLYEALFEGVFLFIVLWLLHRKRLWNGAFGAAYTTGYGFVRFFIEYFREPDSDIGYRIAQDADAVIYRNTSLLNISTGQVLCSLMILGGVIMFIVTYHIRKPSNTVNHIAKKEKQ